MTDSDGTGRPGPPGTGSRRRPGLLNWSYTAVAAVVGGHLATVLAFGAAYFTEPGAARLWEMAPGLVTSAALGIGAMALARGLTWRRVRSWWLLLGTVPAVLAALNHAGVTGNG